MSSSETFIDLLVSVFALERLLSKSEHVPMVGRPSESALPAADEGYFRSENERTVGKNERLCKDTCNTYASSFSTISFLYSFFLSLPSFVLSQFSFDSLLLIIKSKWLSPFYCCFSFFSLIVDFSFSSSFLSSLLKNIFLASSFPVLFSSTNSWITDAIFYLSLYHLFVFTCFLITYSFP